MPDVLTIIVIAAAVWFGLELLFVGSDSRTRSRRRDDSEFFGTDNFKERK